MSPFNEGHILFDECILAFRPDGAGDEYKRSKPYHSYILTDFIISSEWVIAGFKVLPSLRIELPNGAIAFISKVENPESWNGDSSHLFGEALSTVVTFVTGRLCRSPRSGIAFYRDQLSNELIEMGMLHPLTLGQKTIAEDEECTELQLYYFEDVCNFVEVLYSIDLGNYEIIMQAMRLIHLSLMTKKLDFGLAYSLVVAAIEAIAQHAVTQAEVEITYDEESEWAARSRNEPDFKMLFNAFKSARHGNRGLSKRYIRFILNHAPIEKWEAIVPITSGQKGIMEFWTENHLKRNLPVSGEIRFGNEIYPGDVSDDDVQNALKKSYSYRSDFVHQGKQPPNAKAVAYERFFETRYDARDPKRNGELLPTYDFLLTIARFSMTSWLKTQQSGKLPEFADCAGASIAG